MAQDHVFNSIQVERPSRNTFDLSHVVNTSFNMGLLVPCAAIDLVPGDKATIGTETLLRFAPLIAPIMSKVNVTIWWFACPDRILFDDPKEWEDFITGQSDDAFLNAYISNMPGNSEGDLLDYIYHIDGLLGSQEILAAPIAAYTKIWDEWFRNQNITTTERHVPLSINVNEVAYRVILEAPPYQRTWEKDYFTAALPWAQKGDSVTLPLLEAGNADVVLSGVNTAGAMRDASGGTIITTASSVDIDSAGDTQANATDAYYDPRGTLAVNINAAAATINQLRQAYRLQEFLELDAMGGTRYTEKIYAHFGVKSPDSRLQRPELLGRWTGRMAVSEVLQTSAAHEDTVSGRGSPLGTMGGHGISVIGGSPLTYYATEHTWLMCIINVQPKPQYQQGIQRKFTRLDHLDYYWPKFAHIGEQEIRNEEISRGHATPDATFGYAPRYSEYRYEGSTVAGEMRTTLSHWHLGRIFSSDPDLNDAFVYCNPSARIFNTLYTGGGEPEYSSHQLFGAIHHNIHVSRLMPKYGRPNL